MTEQTEERPLCPQCGESPTEVTVQISPESWQDMCQSCASKQGDGAEVIPIEGAS